MERLKEVRVKAGVTQHDIAEILKIDRTTYNKYENGASNPTPETLSRIADYFHVTVDYLLGRSDDPAEDGEKLLPGFYPVKKKKFPVLGKVSCGEPVFAEEDRETWTDSFSDIDADFCLRAVGDSMTGAHIEDGDLVFIKQMDIVPNGCIAVVLIEDEATIKYIDYRPESATLILTPANPVYRTQIYQGEELNRIRVLGMAVCLQKSLVKLH